MKVLSFGHIPEWAGGRQHSGLANVIYQLAKNMALCEGITEAMCATDVFELEKNDGKLTIYGWNKTALINYVLSNPLCSICWLLRLLVFKFKYGSAISVSGSFFKGIHLSRCIDLFSPDVVHLHGMNACVYSVIVPKKVSIIVTMHGFIGNNESILHHKALSKMESEVCRSFRYKFIAFIAEKLIHNYKELYGIINSPVVTVLNAYDGSMFYYVKQTSHEKLTLITIASLSENKGQLRVLEAIKYSELPIKYVCVGDGSEEMINKLSEYASDNGIDFEYKGKKNPPEIREELARADYMILPSNTEGFGLVYLESIACGVPIVLPKNLPIVGEKDIIQPDINSVLLNSSSIESIVEILPRLTNMNFNRKAVSESVISYSWKNISNQYKQYLYEF